MGRFVAPSLDQLSDVDLSGASDEESLSFDSASGIWLSSNLYEKNANKNSANGYVGLDASGNISGGTF